MMRVMWMLGFCRRAPSYCSEYYVTLVPKNRYSFHRPCLQRPTIFSVPHTPIPPSLPRPLTPSFSDPSLSSLCTSRAVKQNKLRLRQNWLVAKQWPWDAPYDQIKDCKKGTYVVSFRSSLGRGGGQIVIHATLAKYRRSSHPCRRDEACRGFANQAAGARGKDSRCILLYFSLSKTIEYAQPQFNTYLERQARAYSTLFLSTRFFIHLLVLQHL